MDAGRARASFSFPAGLAWSACGLTLALIACAYTLLILNRHTGAYDLLWPIDVVLCAFVGAVVGSRRPTNPVGWLFLGGGASLALQEFTREYAAYGLLTNPGSLSLAQAMAWLLSWIYVPGVFLLICFLPLYFPDGRLLSPRWRWVARSAFFITVAMTLNLAFLPGEIKDTGLVNPLGMEALEPVGRLLDNILFVSGFAIVFVSVASLVVRFRRSREEERQQIKWLAYAASAIPVWFLVSPAVEALDIPFLFTVIDVFLFAGVPVAVGIAILKYRLYDIDMIINRTLVYGVLTVCTVVIYVLVVGYLGALLQVEDNLLISLAATGVVAALFAPLRDRLQRGVNRLMYGERDEPYAAISRLSERLGTALEPDAVLPTIVEIVREALKLPYAAIVLPRDGGFEVAASSGEKPPADSLALPLHYGGETVGRLLLGPRAGEAGFSPADRRLLDGLARHAGVAVHGVRVMADLRRSREGLVLAREEERRRLRRDLHDELAPTLAALGLSAATVGELIPADPKGAASANDKLRTAIRATVGDIRRLVYDLRPSALDDLGLVGAIKERVSRQGVGDKGFRATVEAPEKLPPLPAAVEVAVYRIVQEALTNVSRHAQASTCFVRLACPDGRFLEVEITDDGVGLPHRPEGGIGLHSMRERAAELGGTCTVDSPPTGGTRVLARLPLPKEESGFRQQASGENKDLIPDA